MGALFGLEGGLSLVTQLGHSLPKWVVRDMSALPTLSRIPARPVSRSAITHAPDDRHENVRRIARCVSCLFGAGVRPPWNQFCLQNN
jgi:hypothetical protein